MSLNIPFRIYNNIQARSLSSTLSREQYFEIIYCYKWKFLFPSILKGQIYLGNY